MREMLGFEGICGQICLFFRHVAWEVPYSIFFTVSDLKYLLIYISVPHK